MKRNDGKNTAETRKEKQKKTEDKTTTKERKMGRKELKLKNFTVQGLQRGIVGRRNEEKSKLNTVNYADLFSQMLPWQPAGLQQMVTCHLASSCLREDYMLVTLQTYTCHSCIASTTYIVVLLVLLMTKKQMD